MDIIKELRKQKGLSQNALAELCGVHQTAVSQWEKGRTTPDLDSLKKLAKALGVSAETLLGGEAAKDENKIPGFSRISADAVSEKLGSSDIFALTVNDDAMSPSLLPGDTVIVNRRDIPVSGELAAVTAGGSDAFITRIIKKGTSVLLVPENSSYEPLIYSENDFISLPVTVLGKVIELRRKF